MATHDTYSRFVIHALGSSAAAKSRTTHASRITNHESRITNADVSGKKEQGVCPFLFRVQLPKESHLLQQKSLAAVSQL